MCVRSLGQEDALEEGMATHSGILAWKIPWTEEPRRLQSIGSQRVGHDWRTAHTHMRAHTHTHTHGWDKEVRIRHEKTCAIYYKCPEVSPVWRVFFPTFKILLFFLICACVFVNVHVCVSQEQYFMLCLI